MSLTVVRHSLPCCWFWVQRPGGSSSAELGIARTTPVTVTASTSAVAKSPIRRRPASPPSSGGHERLAGELEVILILLERACPGARSVASVGERAGAMTEATTAVSVAWMIAGKEFCLGVRAQSRCGLPVGSAGVLGEDAGRFLVSL